MYEYFGISKKIVIFAFVTHTIFHNAKKQVWTVEIILHTEIALWYNGNYASFWHLKSLFDSREGNNMDIANKIRKKRKVLGYTQKSLAKEAGVTWQTVSSAERGKPITVTTLEKILNVLGLDITITD